MNFDRKQVRITSWVLTGLFASFMLFDTVLHVTKEQHAVATAGELGLPADMLVVVGILEAIFLAVSLIPRTAALGAVLLTAYFGGAIAINMRVEKPLFSTVLFPIYLAFFLWGGLWLRDARVRALLPVATGT